MSTPVALTSLSPTPAYVTGALCVVGGLIGFARRRSVMSLVGGAGVGALYLYAANLLDSGAANGLETALGASALLLLSSLPRVAKGPVPLGLTLTSLAVGGYYGRVYL
ncbi:transmembrane proteins 14C-domain-containing protein [Schizophyllum commune]